MGNRKHSHAGQPPWDASSSPGPCAILPLFANPMDGSPDTDVPGDIFDSLAALEAAHPGSRVLLGFCVVGTGTGLIPPGHSDWHATPEEAWDEHLAALERAGYGRKSVTLSFVPGDEVHAGDGSIGVSRYVVDSVSLSGTGVRYHAVAHGQADGGPDGRPAGIDFSQDDVGVSVFAARNAAEAPVQGMPGTFAVSVVFDGKRIVSACGDGKEARSVDVSTRAQVEAAAMEAVRDAMAPKTRMRWTPAKPDEQEGGA